MQQIGAPHDIYESPVNHFVADFIGDTNFVEGQIEKIAGEDSIVARRRGLCHRDEAERPAQDGRQGFGGAAPREDHAADAGRRKPPGTVREAVYVGPERAYSVALPMA